MANSRPVSMTIPSSVFDETNTNGLKTVIQKKDAISIRSSNQAKLPINNIINAHSSSSSIDSTGARNANLIEKISLPQMNLTTTTSSTTTDSEFESEQDEQYNEDNSLQLNNLSTQDQHSSKRNSGQQKHDLNIQEQLSRRVRHFQKLFKSEIIDHMPKLIDSYVCAYQGDILLQGKMYITDRYLCFHSRIISYVTKHVYRWEQMENITKERVAFIFPTAIGIQLKHTGKKIIYASFLQRDQAFDKIISIWSRFNNDSNSFQDDDSDYRYTHSGTLKAINSNEDYHEKRNKSKHNVGYEMSDEPEQDDVLQMCLGDNNNKRRPQSISSKSSDDKQQSKNLMNSYKTKSLGKNSNIDQNLLNDLNENNSDNNQTNRNSRHSQKQTDTILKYTSAINYQTSHNNTSLKPHRTRDRTLSPNNHRSLSNVSHSNSSTNLLSNIDSSSSSSLTNLNNNGFLKKYFRIIILSIISILKLLIEYFFLLFNQFKAYPIKSSLLILIFTSILILHSFYLIKLAYRIENRLQSLHHIWPSSSIKTSLPSSKEL